MFEAEEYGYGLKETKGIILKPEWHEDFDNIFRTEPPQAPSNKDVEK
jgi:hypothetical protein